MRRLLAIWIVVLMLLPFAGVAEGVKDESNTGLGTARISNPDVPADKDTPWSGSYVYFGSYNGSPIKFRVLAKDSAAYTTGKALFLDSDAALFEGLFDKFDSLAGARTYFNTWDDSDIRAFLNGPFLEGFDPREQCAIAISTGCGEVSCYEAGSRAENAYGAPVSVNDRAFLLDVAEITNETYGYSSDQGFTPSENGLYYLGHQVKNRVKTGSRTKCWMLRTAAFEGHDDHVAGVLNDGGLYNINVRNSEIGVAPALNIDQDWILFSTSVGTEANAFKLTLIDRNLTIAIPDDGKATVEGTTVTVPYAIGGADAETATRVSVMILDKEFRTGYPNDAGMIAYHALDGENSFEIPAGCDLSGWGTDFHVYLLAESVRGIYETDFASVPVEVMMPENRSD